MKKLWVIPLIGMMCLPKVLAETNVPEQGSTVGIKINADRGGVIQSAFSAVLIDAGLINNNTHYDYLLDVHITLTPFTTNSQNMQFVRFELKAELLDNDGNVLLPYAFFFRDGHVNQEGAESRAFREAVRKINAEYGDLLKEL